MRPARLSPSSGLYGDTIEPSFDAEFVVTRGADVSPILKHVVDLGRKANQNDVFVSKVVTADHPNARPGLEIGFKASEDPAHDPHHGSEGRRRRRVHGCRRSSRPAHRAPDAIHPRDLGPLGG